MKISFGLRFMAVFLALLLMLSWLFVNQALDHIKVSMRQSAETTLVDMAQLLATGLESEIGSDGRLDTARFANRFQAAQNKRFNAQIYQFHKQQLDLQVYVTDAHGIVQYDSLGQHTGQDYSHWQDVSRTLKGEYGARSSFISAEHTQPNDPKHMVVAAPILYQGQIAGVLAVTQPMQQFDVFSLSGAAELRYFVFSGMLLALVIIVLMSWWLTHALGRLSAYAEAMAANRVAPQPRFHEPHFARLAQAIEHLRLELDGKQHVEEYIHGLTHELKTPITGIQAAGEFLQEDDLSPHEQQQLVGRILAANRRMHDLVARILSLAKLENRSGLAQSTAVRLDQQAAAALAACAPTLAAKQIAIHGLPLVDTTVYGDTLLISQAIDNLLANALAFCPQGGDIRLNLSSDQTAVRLRIINNGAPIPDYALPRLFERFFSLPRPDGSGRSSGLGLSFVAQIMALHGGSVAVSNHADGVVAELVFPATPPKQSS